MAALASTQVYIQNDDLRGSLSGLSLGGGQWAFESYDFFVGGTAMWPPFAHNESTTNRASLTYTFNGTSVMAWGLSAPTGNDPVFRVAVDNNPASNTSNAVSFYYSAWYQSPKLDDGQHTIKMDLMHGETLDFMLVTPSPTTPLQGHTLIIDDNYTGIQYTKGWQFATGSTFQGDDFVDGIGFVLNGGNTFMNTTHASGTVGETMTFSYAGMDASVYGLFLAEQIGNLTYTVTIDSNTTFNKTLTSNGPPPSPTPFFKEHPNYQLFSTGPLSPGNHTISMKVADVSGQQTLVVDYITFSPSFPNLASMPNVTASSTSSAATSTVGQSGSPTTAGESGTSTPSPSGTNTGAIAGGVVGGLAFLAIVAFLLWWWRRRRSYSAVPPLSEPEPPQPRRPQLPERYTVEPFAPAPGTPPPMSSKFPHSPSLTTSSPLPTSGKSGSMSAFLGDFVVDGRAGASTASTHALTEVSSSTGSDNENEHLRRRVEQLAAENARLVNEGLAPPAYQ